MPGLDPGIHLFSQESLRRGWIAGSSPAMTTHESILRSLVSIRAAIGVTPVFARAEFLVAAGVAPHPASGIVVGGNEAVPIAHAAIVGGLHLLPDDEALLGDAAGVDAHRLDLAADHEPVDPLPRPLDLAFEVTAAFRDPGRP